MAENINIEIDEMTSRAIRVMLGKFKNKTPSVLKNAINMAARRVRKDLPVLANETYLARSTKMKKNISIKSASVSKLEATVKAKGKPLQLIYFHAKKHGRQTAAKARGRSDRSLKEIISAETGAKAFIATIDNGTDESGNKKKGHRAIMQRTTKARYPLVTFAGPSTPEMLGSRDVYAKIAPDVHKELLRSINRQINRIMGGRQ